MATCGTAIPDIAPARVNARMGPLIRATVLNLARMTGQVMVPTGHPTFRAYGDRRRLHPRAGRTEGQMSKILRMVSVLNAALIFAVQTNPVAAQTPIVPEAHTLKVNVFPAGFNWPLWVAQDQ